MSIANGNLLVSADVTVFTNAQLNLGALNLTESSATNATNGGLNGGGIVRENGTTGAATLTLDTTAGNGSFSGILSVTNTGTTFALVKNGTGTQTLSGANTYNGGTTVNAGTLAITNSGSFGTGMLTVNGGTVDLGAQILTNALGVFNGGTIQNGSITNTGTLTNASGLTTIGGGTLYLGTSTAAGGLYIGAGTMTVNSALVLNSLTSSRYALSTLTNSTLTINGNITEISTNSTVRDAFASGGLTVLNGSNSFSGGVQIHANITNGISTLQIGQVAALGTGGILFGQSQETTLETNILIANLTNSSGGTITNNFAYTGDNGSNGVGNTAIIRSSGTGAATFTGTMSINSGTAGNSLNGQAGNLIFVLGGTNTGSNTFATSIVNLGAGTTTLSKQDTGTWILTGSNSYSGGTTLNAGTVVVGNSNAFGTGVVTFASNSTVAGLANRKVTNAYAIASGVTGAFDVAAGTTLTNSGAITGAGALTTVDTGTLLLSASNSYSGGTTVSAGTLLLANASALGSGAASLASNTELAYNGSGPATLTNNISVSSGKAIIANTSASQLTLGGTLSKNGTVLDLQGGASGINVTGSITGSSANSDLIVDGGGTTTLSASNSYNGPTYIINASTLYANASNALPTANGRSAVALDQSGSGTSTLLLGVSQNIASLSGASSSIVNLGNKTLTVGASNTSTTFAGTISGSGGILDKDGSSTLTLSGANTYSGGTVVSAGQLTLGSADASALGTGGVSVTGGTLDLGANIITNTLAPLASGTIQNGSISNNGGNYSISGGTVNAILAGNNGLNASGGTLGGANTFTGTTAITSAGTLVLSTAGSLASTNINLGTSGSRGTLDLTAKSAYTLTSNQTLDGYGTLSIGSAGSGTLTENGNLAPSSVGSSGNTISVTGNLALGSASATTLQIQGTNSFDKISVTGNIAFNGNLFLNINGYTPVAGTTFDLFSATSYAIGLTNVALTGSWFPGTFTETSTGIWNYATNSESWTFNEANGQLAITAVPEPATYVLFGFGALVLMVVYRRKAAQR